MNTVRTYIKHTETKYSKSQECMQRAVRSMILTIFERTAIETFHLPYSSLFHNESVRYPLMLVQARIVTYVTFSRFRLCASRDAAAAASAPTISSKNVCTFPLLLSFNSFKIPGLSRSI